MRTAASVARGLLAATAVGPCTRVAAERDLSSMENGCAAREDVIATVRAASRSHSSSREERSPRTDTTAELSIDARAGAPPHTTRSIGTQNVPDAGAYRRSTNRQSESSIVTVEAPSVRAGDSADWRGCADADTRARADRSRPT